MNSRSKKFISYYRPYLGLFFADLACAFVVAGTTLALPLGASYVTSLLQAGNSPDTLDKITLMGVILLVLLIAHTGSNLFVDYRGHSMGALMEGDMRRELFEHFQKLSFGFYDEQRTGQLMTRITNDVFWLSELFHHGPEDLTIAVLKFAGVLIILLSLNLQLSLILLLFLPVMTVYAFYFNKRMNAALRVTKDRIGDINAQVEDTLAGIRVVKSFTNEAIEEQKFAYANRRFVESRCAGYKSEMFFSGGMDAFTQLITITIVILGGVAIVHQTLNLADLVTYLLCVGILVEPIQRLVNFARLYQEGITGFNRFMEIMEIEPEIQDSPNAIELAQAQGNIEFRDVSFKYKEGYNEVIKHISLDIKVGEYVALVGFSGVGKTTLCSLIPRFYEVSAGEIRLDGINIRDLSLSSLRRNIGDCPAGRLSVRRDGRRQHPLRQIGRQSGRDRRGSEAGERPRLHHGAAGRLRHRRRSARRQTLRRAKAALEHRAGVPQRPAGADLRRGDQRARQRERTGGAGIAGEAGGQPHHPRDRAPALDRPQRPADRRADRSRHRGAGHARGVDRARRHLRQSV